MNTRLVFTVLFVAAVAVNMATAQTTTTANTTATANATTAAATTVTPSLTADVLNTTISRINCGTQQLCLAQPVSCDPSSSGSCYFVFAQPSSGQNFQFGLSGSSTGYIALTLASGSTVGNNDTTYICANNNGIVQFFSTVFNNNGLSLANLNVTNVQGKVNGSTIQCIFNTTVASTKGVVVAVLTGSLNKVSFGFPVVQILASVADLSNPNSTVTYSNTTGTTTSPASHAVTFQQTLTQALLITVGVLGLTML